MAYLTCTKLAIGYAGTPIAGGISFSVGAGNALFVVGENGAGKSTLLKTLLGLLPPIEGEISLGSGASATEVGYLPQKGESQRDFPASAWEIALSGRASQLGARPFYSRADRSAAKVALERAGAFAFRDAPFGSLSGGQQQRVLLARALASEPKLLVLDEPTTGLDPDAAEALYETIDDLRANGAGVLAVTHDVAAALPHATHVLHMAAGRAALSSAESFARESFTRGETARAEGPTTRGETASQAQPTTRGEAALDAQPTTRGENAPKQSAPQEGGVA